MSSKKRKLASRLFDSNQGSTAAAKFARRNPFLESGTTSVEDCDASLADLAAFLEFAEYEYEQRPTKAGTSVLQLQESLLHLLVFLEGQSSKDFHDREARQLTRTASVLLPWSLKRLLASAESDDHHNSLLWRTLASSLHTMESLLDNSHAQKDSLLQTMVTQTFSTNVMCKLMPLATSVSRSVTSASAYAAACHQLLIQSNFVLSLEMALECCLFRIVVNGKLAGSSPRDILQMIQATAKSVTKTNPKKAFQVLTKEENLLELARLYACLEDNVNSGDHGTDQQLCLDTLLDCFVGTLFEPDHLDGFKWLAKTRAISSVNGDKILEAKSSMDCCDRETTSPTKIQCYQENLLQSFENLVLNPSSYSDEQNLLLVVRLLPVILRVFVQKMSELESNNLPATDRLKVGKDLVPLQLYIFGNITTILLRAYSLAKATADAKLCCMRSLDQSLQQWTNRDNLVSMDARKLAERFRCLENITIVVLKSSWSTNEAFELASRILERLVHLDHSLVTSKLETFIEFIASPRFHQAEQGHSLIENRTNCAAELVLMTTVLQTYAQLRQFHRIVVSLLRVASKLHSNNGDGMQLKGLQSILSHDCVMRTFAEGVSGSPIFETTKMFESLDSWIEVVATTNAKTERVESLLRLGVTQIATELLNAVKVDESTAPVIAQCCENLLNKSAKKLCEKVLRDQQEVWQTRLGVCLCRCITQLQIQCAFWLGHQYSQASELDSWMTCCVKDLVFAANTTKTGDETIDDLQCLACLRLCRLDFLIGNRTSEEDTTLRWEYKQEARRLTLLTARWAGEVTGAKCGWGQVAQAFSSWVKYASKDTQQRFLMWMFSALAGMSSEDNEEKRLALSIIADSSFFELGEIELPVTASGLATIRLLIEAAAECLIKEAGDGIRRKALTETTGACQYFASSHVEWTASSPKHVARKLIHTMPCSSSRENGPNRKVCSLLRGAVQVARAVNELQTEKRPLVPMRNAMSAFRLEYFCRSLCDTDEAMMGMALDLTSELRSIAAKDFASVGQKVSDLQLAIPNGIVYILDDISETSIEILKRYSEANCQRLALATADLVMSIGECYLKHGCREAFWKGMKEFVNKWLMDKVAPSEAETVVLCTVARSLVSSLARFDKKLPSDLAALEAFLMQLINWVSSLQECVCVDSEQLQSEVYVMVSALFVFSSRMGPEQIACMRAIRSLASRLLLRIVASQGHGKDTESAMYLLACYAVTNPQLKQSQWLLHQLLQGVLKRDWLKASIGSLICALDSDSLFYAISSVNECISDGNFQGLPLLPLLFRNLNQNEHDEILSSITATVHRKCLVTFCVRDDADLFGSGERLTNASSALISLVQEKRQQWEINERDVAQILAQIPIVVSSEYRPNGVVGSCLRLLAALIQYLPQRVFSCAPSLMTALHSLLKQLLFGELDEPTITSACHDFARLLELLSVHKDVIKKHLLCLVLEYLNYLEQQSSSVFRKECITSSFMHLLGILSKHEIEQLNTLMNPTMKMHFRPFHQSFLKLNAHQG